MIITLDISVNELFSQVVDQTLYDNRIKARNGQTLSDTALSKDDWDIFYVNLKTVADNVYSGSLGLICGYELREDFIYAEIEVRGKVNPDTIASRYKDLLKYGILSWWYSTQDASLYEKYAYDYTDMLSKLKTQLAGFTKRPYSYY